MIIAVSTSNKPWEEIGMPASALAYYRLSSSLLIRKAFKGKPCDYIYMATILRTY